MIANSMSFYIKQRMAQRASELEERLQAVVNSMLCDAGRIRPGEVLLVELTETGSIHYTWPEVRA